MTGEDERVSDSIEQSYPLSPMQQGMLYHSLAAKLPGVEIEQIVGELQEELDARAFETAWELVVCRHDVLRTAFCWDNLDQPRQEVHGRVRPEWIRQDWRGLSDAAADARLREFLESDRRRGFEMDRVPLLRFALFRVRHSQFRFVWTFHHALLDGRSFILILKEVFSFYEALRQDQNPDAPRPRPYREHIEWLEQQDPSKAETFWRQTLKGFTTPTPLLAGGQPRFDPGHGPSADAQELRLPEAATLRLRKFAEENELTLTTLVQAAWAILLSRYSGEAEVIFGATRACRHSSVDGTAAMVGLFINTVPMRLRVNSRCRLREWLKEIRKQWLTLREYEQTPLVCAQRWSEVPPGAALFDSIVVFENASLDSALRPQGGPWLNRRFALFEQPNAALTLAVYGDAELLLKIEYDRGQFERADIRRRLGHLQTLLLAMPDAAAGPVGELPMLTREESRQLLDEWNPARMEPNGSATLHELFEAQVESQPDAWAVVCGETRLTYRELNRRANRLAHVLRQCGVGPEVLVGLCLERSAELVVGILAVLKAGGAYVPIDLSYPQERVAFILEDTRAPVLLTQRSLAARLPAHSAKVICLDALGEDEETHGEWFRNQAHRCDPSPPPAHEALALSAENPGRLRTNLDRDTNPRSCVSAGNLAYVIYTSGSTGRPKGVLVTHGNVVRLFQSTKEWFGFNGADVGTLFHSYAFDFSVWEIWGALLYGGRLVVVPYLTSRSPEEFRQLLIRERVTVLNQTPSAFRQFIAADAADPSVNPNGASAPRRAELHSAVPQTCSPPRADESKPIPMSQRAAECNSSIRQTESLRYDPARDTALPRPESLSLRLVIFGGEALELTSLKPWFDRHGDKRPELVNMFGITETTVHVTYRPLARTDLGSGSVLGGPIPDLQTYVLDREFRPVPIGVPGELYVGGAGVSRGYWNRPELTAERFVPHPFSAAPGARLYRTGDWVRWLPNRDLEYLGRIDQQVKIRGFRVELGEIESLLARHAQVREAIVLVREETPGDKRLAAFLTVREPAPTSDELREFLRSKIPEYMIPAAFVIAPAFPLTTNGKVDRRALGRMEIRSGAESKAFQPPGTASERMVAEVWQEVLRIERVGLDGNFFELGGNSLLIVQVQSKLRRRLNKDLPITKLFQYPTVRALGRYLNELPSGGPTPQKVHERAQRRAEALAHHGRSAQS